MAKKQKELKQPKEYKSVKKTANLVMAVADLGAVIILSLVQGSKMGPASKIIAVPIAFDLIVRLSVIAKPYFKE